MIATNKDSHLSIKAGNDEWYCDSYSADLIPIRERRGPTVIFKTFKHWCEQSGGDIPIDRHYDPKGILEPCEWKQLLHVETERPNPKNYLIVSPGTEPRNSVPHTLKLFANPLHQRILQFDLLECKETRRPLYQGINQNLDGVESTYRRVLLPVRNEEGKVTKVYSVYHLIESYHYSAFDMQTT